MKTPRTMASISRLMARQILDSRGNPTVEVDVYAESGDMGRAAVPSGASTGSHEAYELRDRNPACYMGKSVSKAVHHVENVIAPALVGADVCDQGSLDELMCALDGTARKSALGANAILAVSLAAARAAAAVRREPLYRYLGGMAAHVLPVPLMNLINGGAHADHGLQVQELMIVPWGLGTYAEALRAGVEIYHATKSILREKQLSTNVGDEGGFVASMASVEHALDILLAAIEKAGYQPYEQVALALDVAATEFYDSKAQQYVLYQRRCSADDMVSWYADLCGSFPIVSIEDGLAEDDWEGWALLTAALGNRVQLVGDDLFVTQRSRLETGISKRVANAILIKPNQVGTLTETLDTVQLARQAGYRTILSHRSGDTEDAFIADLSVALHVGQIKTGAPCRGERTSKYNQLLRIEEELGAQARYAGRGALRVQSRWNSQQPTVEGFE